MIAISTTVNGSVRSARVPPRLLLSDFLRDELGLTGVHVGCEGGECGACTVVLDGRTARSCLLFAVQVDGRRVETIEGLAEGPSGDLHPLQEAFAEHHGLQCGFCTPGLILAAKELLEDNPDPTEEQVRDALAGNLCRCTGYASVVDAVRAAAGAMRG